MNGQSKSLNIALFIDADNAPSRKIDRVLSELSEQGTVSIRRAYGNWKSSNLDSWVKVLHQHAIQPIQQFDLIKGKNATDMAMTIDAMDVMFSKPVDMFCLVSSDCDFTPLVIRLRAEGKQVVGCGERKSAEPFVQACSSFIFFDDPLMADEQRNLLISHLEDSLSTVETDTVYVEKHTSNQLKGNTKLMNLLRTTVEQASDENGWALLCKVGSILANNQVSSKQYGYRQLVDMFEAINLFEVTRRDGSHPSVREVKRARAMAAEVPATPCES